MKMKNQEQDKWQKLDAPAKSLNDAFTVIAKALEAIIQLEIKKVENMKTTLDTVKKRGK